MRALGICLVSLFVSVGLAACKEEGKAPGPPPPSANVAASAVPKPSAAASVVVPASTTAAPIASVVPSASGSAAAHPDKCEVEIFGEVVIPKGHEADRIVVYVAQDDCLADDAHILGHVVVPPKANTYMIEVWPKWGTDVTICAALDPQGGKQSELYGKAKGTFHAEAVGEVTFNQVKIEIAPGKPHKFPADMGKP